MLLAVVSDVLQIPCRWKVAPRPMVSPTLQAEAILQISRIKSLGKDEERLTFSSPDQTTTISGNRIFVLTVRVEAYAGTEAWQYCSNLVTRIQRLQNLAALRAGDCALVDSSEILELPTFYDNRLVSSAQVDITFAYAVNDLYPSEDESGWIETTDEPVGVITS